MIERQEFLPATEVPVQAMPMNQTFIERHGISPIFFVVLSLGFILLLYQGLPAIVILIVFGFKIFQGQKIITPENVDLWRVFTGLGEVVLLLLPVLYLVRLVSYHPRNFFCLRFPKIQLLVLPIVGILSLQQMLQIYLQFQEKIPLPELLEKFVQNLKETSEEATKLLASSTSLTELLWVILIIAIIPAVVEEFLFRGLVQRSFEKSMHPLKSVILTGMIFAVFHINPSLFIALSILGIYLGFLAMRANSIWVSVAAHFYNNLFVCIAAYLHLNDDLVVIGDPTRMSIASLLVTFFVFTMIFVFSTYFFLKVTEQVAQQSAAQPRIS